MVVIDALSITITVDEDKITNLMPILITFPYPANYGNPYQYPPDPLYPNIISDTMSMLPNKIMQVMFP